MTAEAALALDPHANAVLRAALRYAPRTLPLRGKVPNVGRDWPSWQATADTIRAHWATHPHDNVGVRTGRGLIVLDVDPRAGGHDHLADLEHEHGELPETLEVRTGGGGRHLYFHGPSDLASYDLASGLEVKSAGRQVVAPPSVHPDTGALYEWLPDRAPGRLPLAILPGWIAAMTAVADPAAPDRPAAKAASTWTKMLAEGIPQGRRHANLCSLGGHLFARRSLDPHLVAHLVRSVNQTACRPPLPTAELERIIDDIAAREARKRGVR